MSIDIPSQASSGTEQLPGWLRGITPRRVGTALAIAALLGLIGRTQRGSHIAIEEFVVSTAPIGSDDAEHMLRDVITEPRSTLISRDPVLTPPSIPVPTPEPVHPQERTDAFGNGNEGILESEEQRIARETKEAHEKYHRESAKELLEYYLLMQNYRNHHKCEHNDEPIPPPPRPGEITN